jgi:hypothetical protein
MVIAADQNDLKLNIGRVMRLIVLRPCPTTLFEILDLAGLDLRFVIGILAFDCSCVGAAIVDRDLRGNTIAPTWFAEETQRRFAVPFDRQQEVYRSASLIDYSTQIFRLLPNPYLGLVQSPTNAHRSLVSSEFPLWQRHEI